MKNSSLGTKLLLAAVTLAVLVYFGVQGLRYLDDPLMTSLAYEDQVEESIDVSGYVVREESVLPDESSGSLRLQRSEGERVSDGGTVALVYADASSIQLQDQMDSLRDRIEQLEYAQAAALGTEVSLKLDSQILQGIVDLRTAIAENRLDRAEEYGKDLRSLVLKRDYTDADTEDLAAQITSLQTELKTLQSQAAASIRRITAPQAGLYSAVVDGYETVLTPENVSSLTPSQLKAIQPDESVQSQVGKLVLGDTWYYAVIMDTDQARELEEEGSVTLRFAKSADQDLSVTVDSVSAEENGQVVVVFRGTTYLSQLTLLRQQSAQIIRRIAEGIRIPKEAIRTEKVTVDEETGERTSTAMTGVYCMVGAEARFKPVEVVYSGDDFVLVTSTLAESASASQEKVRLRSGDEIIIAADDLYDGKVLNRQIYE